MQESIISTFLIPAVLAVMMVGMGMTLQPVDFQRLYQYPKAVITGLTSQVFLLPVLGFVIASLAPLPPEFKVGIMIVALCPGGIGSNLLTLLARADGALSITLTATSNILLVVTLPFFINFFLRWFMGTDTNLQLPVAETALTTALLTILPIVIGMSLRRRYGEAAERMEPTFRKVSAAFLVLLMCGVGLQNREVIAGSLLTLGPATVALNSGSMAIGFGLGALVGLSLAQRVAIAIETGFHNIALALVVTTTFLQNPQMALAPAFYGGVMFLGGFGLIGLLKVVGANPAAANAVRS
ncbi:MAG TPA: bile acid:sodium symporter family protein [Dongiaceae bacterium]|nr:bile acid:sodium symporter family protein [Dongiaceae bacterium]